MRKLVCLSTVLVACLQLAWAKCDGKALLQCFRDSGMSARGGIDCNQGHKFMDCAGPHRNACRDTYLLDFFTDGIESVYKSMADIRSSKEMIAADMECNLGVFNKLESGPLRDKLAPNLESNPDDGEVQNLIAEYPLPGDHPSEILRKSEIPRQKKEKIQAKTDGLEKVKGEGVTSAPISALLVSAILVAIFS